MSYYYDKLIDSTIIENSLFSRYNWELYPYVGALSCVAANYTLNYGKTVQPLKYTRIDSSHVLSKINLYGKKHYEQDMEGLKVEILDSITKFFYLTQKKKQNNGLYYFNDNSARLDITGLITNGLLLF